jgi:hypothetical protein
MTRTPTACATPPQRAGNKERVSIRSRPTCPCSDKTSAGQVWSERRDSYRVNASARRRHTNGPSEPNSDTVEHQTSSDRRRSTKGESRQNFPANTGVPASPPGRAIAPGPFPAFSESPQIRYSHYRIYVITRSFQSGRRDLNP